MATYTVATSKHATLTANTVDTVTLGIGTYVEVLNRSTSDIYFTLDNTTPTIGGDDTLIVTAGTALRLPENSGQGMTVKLISASPSAYSVTSF
jgi:hypothetical protein